MNAKTLVLILMLSGCASDRYLTEKEDADLRKVCAKAGCVTIPVPLWEQIKRLLGVVSET